MGFSSDSFSAVGVKSRTPIRFIRRTSAGGLLGFFAFESTLDHVTSWFSSL
jgi:hypothetical protein